MMEIPGYSSIPDCSSCEERVKDEDVVIVKELVWDVFVEVMGNKERAELWWKDFQKTLAMDETLRDMIWGEAMLFEEGLHH